MTSTPITTADIAKGKIDDALSVREKIGYGLGDAGGTVITCLIMNFLTFRSLMHLLMDVIRLCFRVSQLVT